MRGAALDETPGMHDKDGIGDVRKNARVVSNHQERRAEGVPQPAQQSADLDHKDRIERRERLVGNDERRSSGQRLGDEHALALSAAELVRISIAQMGCIGETDKAQEGIDFGAHCMAAHGAMRAHDFRHLIAGAEHGVEREQRILKNERNSGAADALEGSLVGGDEVHCAEPDQAANGKAVAGEQSEKGVGESRLAAAGFAEKTDDTCWGDVEGQVGKNWQGSGVTAGDAD